MTASQKPKKANARPEPHTEKSTMTEPQEEFIEQKGQPSTPASPPEPPPKHKEKEKPGKQAER